MRFWSHKKKNYPDFWKEYLSFFKNRPKKHVIREVRFIAFDTETTGFDYKEDRILSIGAVGVKNNAIDVVDQLELYLDQDVFKAETVKIHQIRKNGMHEKVSEKKALEKFITYIEDSILVAHHAGFDQRMINKALERNGLGKLKNKILDTGTLFKRTKHQVYLIHDPNKYYSLDALCNDLKISKSDRHTASGDAFITALAFLKIISKLRKEYKGGIEIKDLFKT